MKKNQDLRGHSGDFSRKNKIGETEFFYVRLSLHAPLPQSVSVGSGSTGRPALEFPQMAMKRAWGQEAQRRALGS